jgi:dihydroxy-acid dehydratase
MRRSVNAIAKHIGVELDNDDWKAVGYDIPLLVNLQPAGEYLGEDYYRAGGVPAVVAELIAKGKIKPAHHRQRQDAGIENCEGRFTATGRSSRPTTKPMRSPRRLPQPSSGNLFDSAIMKTSVITPEFRKRYLENPKDPMAFEGTAIVFDGPEDYHHRIDDPALKIDEHRSCSCAASGRSAIPARPRS